MEPVKKRLVQLYEQRFGRVEARPFAVFAEAPGRLEVCGNHTDHQGGCVIAAALDRRVSGLATPNGSRRVWAFLEGFGSVYVDMDAPDAREVHPHEKGTPAALIRGMCAAYLDSGGTVHGFDLVTTSDLPVGAGLSSSAAFEMLIGIILRALDEEGARGRAAGKGAAGAAPTEDGLLALALEGVRAEREHFGKSCGAQDQIASAFGGLVFMDFALQEPCVVPLDCDFSRFGFQAILIDSGVDHSRYGADYESVPADMRAVARFFGVQRLGDVDARDYLAQRSAAERALGAAAVMRADHFYDETQRVRELRDALVRGDASGFLRLVGESGRSSETKLRNIVPSQAQAGDVQAHRPQEILDACAELLAGEGAWRIHGGGFGGSILALVPDAQADAFEREMNGRFGPDACMRVGVSSAGACAQCVRFSDGPLLVHSSVCEGEVREESLEWTGDTRYGTLEISINLRKPEKDPRAIARAAAAEDAAQQEPTSAADGASSCDLCRENAQFDAARECAVDARIGVPEFALDGETWRIHFSPYRYFDKHCIVLTERHRPMRIDRACVDRLLACVDRFPFFFMGSNADLPLVGGSILAHDHFQGGQHVFPLMRAPIAQEVALRGLGGAGDECESGVTAGIVRWPASTLRLEGTDARALVDAAARVIEAWRTFDYPEGGIFSHTADVPHNTVTLIAYRRSFLRAASSAGDACATADPGDSALDPYVIDMVLRNNRTTPERPFGLFHVPEELHRIKKENIGLIEIMGRAVLPARLLAEMPELRTSRARRREITDAFTAILEETGVFKDNGQGREGWQRFIRSINGE